MISLTRETLLKIKKTSSIVAAIGIILTILGSAFYYFADYELGKLDDMKLDQEIKLDQSSDISERIRLGK